MKPLDDALAGFAGSLSRFELPDATPRRVSDLLTNTNWPWGYASGLYCFIAHGEVVYIGRALGATIGSRIWSHLRDEAWADVVEDDDAVVLTYEFESTDAFLVAALELYLIDALKPRFNKHLG